MRNNKTGVQFLHTHVHAHTHAHTQNYKEAQHKHSLIRTHPLWQTPSFTLTWHLISQPPRLGEETGARSRGQGGGKRRKKGR